MKSKLPNVGTTIFTVMSKLATDCGALNLSQGFPNFNIDPKLSELVFHYMKTGMNQYAPMTGVQPLREAIAAKVECLYGVIYDPETEITITSGATEVLFAAITAVVEQGDEVIIFEPAYDSYLPAVELMGGVPVLIHLQAPNFKIDWEIVKQKITPKTKLIILNTPHNPTGSVLEADDLENLAQLVKNTSIFLLSDEVYEHIIFDGKTHQSLLRHPVLRERAFICNSFGKTFHVTGWKVGYCLAPKELSAEFRKVHQYLTFSTFTPVQYALADYLAEPSHYLSISDFYQQKRDLFLSYLNDSIFTFQPAEGSFFQMVAYKGLSDINDYELAIKLTKEIGVASIPVSVFYSDKTDNKILRFCFAKDEEMLKIAGEKIAKLTSDNLG